jgi:thymidylate kinase
VSRQESATVGLLVNIEAIDRGGKTTRATSVITALTGRGLRVARVAFPERPAKGQPPTTIAHLATGILIDAALRDGMVLMEERDTLFRSTALSTLDKADRVDIALIIEQKLLQVLFSVNRREAVYAPGGLLDLLEANDVVVLERGLSARAYGVANGVSKVQIDALESDLPSPDITFLLDIDPAIARGRRSEDTPDKYEANPELQSEVRHIYLEMARTDAETAKAEGREPTFVRLDATLPEEVVTETIVRAVVERLGRAAGTAAV